MKKQIKNCGLALIISLSLVVSGCDAMNAISRQEMPNSASEPNTNDVSEGLKVITPTTQETQLTDGMSAITYAGDYGFDAFLESGGAASDGDVVAFLGRNLISELMGISLSVKGFGCSTLSVKDSQGDAQFGRNFDWQPCKALIVSATPENGYASLSTVNLDFLSGYSPLFEKLPAKAKTLAGLYAPLDGMNERGLCAAVLMISDAATINQNTNKPDLTTTTAIRLLLDKAANVSEAIALLEQYDMHASMDMMVHFALSDATGRSVVVEYVDNKMVVTETPVVTNFYLAEGEKKGIGSSQSHTRYTRLMDRLGQTPTMDMNGLRDAMDSVSKDDFGEFESTEWSIVYNQTKGEARYYHRENYNEGFVFQLK